MAAVWFAASWRFRAENQSSTRTFPSVMGWLAFNLRETVVVLALQTEKAGVMIKLAERKAPRVAAPFLRCVQL